MFKGINDETRMIACRWVSAVHAHAPQQRILHHETPGMRRVQVG